MTCQWNPNSVISDVYLATTYLYNMNIKSDKHEAHY